MENEAEFEMGGGEGGGDMVVFLMEKDGGGSVRGVFGVVRWDGRHVGVYGVFLFGRWVGWREEEEEVGAERAVGWRWDW